MSYPEHLIENAIVCLEENKGLDYFLEQPYNREMLKHVSAKPTEIWDMAMYVYYSYVPWIKSKTIDEMEKRYGYTAPEEEGN